MRSISRSQIPPFQTFIRNLPKAKFFQALLWLGVICWATTCGRQLGLLASTARQLPAKNVAATPSTDTAAQSPLERSSPLDGEISSGNNSDLDDAHSSSPEFTTDSRGLELQSTVIGQSQRVAVISGIRVIEGTTTTIRGITLRVNSVFPRQVELSIDGTPVRLPLDAGVELAAEVSTNSSAANQ